MEPEIPPILRWVSKQTIAAAAADVVSQAQAGLLSQLDLARQMLDFVFRTPGGVYCFCDALQGQWYRFDGTDWQPETRIPERLEGPDALPVRLPLPPDVEPPPPSPTASPTAVLAEAIRALRTAYTAGQIDSLTAEALLGQRFLVDRQGTAWTAGAQSGRWYAFSQGQWGQAAAPPDPGTLARLRPPSGPCPSCGHPVEAVGPCPQCGTAIPPVLEGLSDEGYGPVLAFLEQAGTLPEAVTAPWMPPPGYPNVQLPVLSRRVPLVVPTATAPEPRWLLHAVSDVPDAQTIVLGETLRLGRATDNDLVLRLSGVSRYHAVISRQADGYAIADQGSANGTTVNGQRVEGEVLLQPGDKIAIANEAQFVVAVEQGQTRCSACGAEVRPGVKFCPQCGTAIRETEKASRSR